MNLEESQAKFAEVLDKHRVLVCVGSGGVGKTTTSAVIALHAALLGRKTLVLTIDPARRLANSLGVDQLENEPRRIPIEHFEGIGLEPRGELWAMMLDMKQSFDRLINRYAPDAEAKRRILRNRLYQYFSTSLAGTQEYAAAEKLYEIDREGTYDLIVLDTPPTSHALDFLEAPSRLIEAINSKALQWLYKPSVLGGRSGFGFFSMGTSLVLKNLSRFTGGEMLEQLSVFLEAFSTLFGGFRERAEDVRRLLMSEACAFAVVTAPDALTIEEAVYFHRRLGDERVKVASFVVNRVHPAWVPEVELHRPATELLPALANLHPEFADALPDQGRTFVDRLKENAAEFQVLARLDAASMARLNESAGDGVPIVQVPYFPRDIHSLEGLDLVRRSLFGNTLPGNT